MKLHLTQPDAHNATARLLTTTDVAEILQVSRSTVLNWCRDGRILAIRLPSGQYRVPQTELDRILTPTSPSASSAASPSRAPADIIPGQGELL
ncbi:MAG: helix-turn-helix domain-containing protein [Flaviflexus sp.]|uniref:helix-turn-helix domain-containing protein n=1 Tax=Flaviflexus sp. TaxID=1969482 RepID=UPI003F90DD5E